MMDQSQKSGKLVVGIQGIQWAVFMLTNIVAVPVVVGAAFHMSPADISTFMQRMLFVTGAATLVQVFFGHRLPIVEGGAGMWWALFILLGAMSAPTERGQLLQQLEFGLVSAGIFLVILSFLPIIGKIRNLFTPIVTGVYLILLVSQMSGSFFKSMLGVTSTGHLDGRIAAISFIEVFIILMISLRANGIWRSMGPLIGIAAGWLLFHLFGLMPSSKISASAGWFVFPKIFSWGTPQFDFGIVLTSVITGVVLISNVIASILVIGMAIQKEIQPIEHQRGIFGNGISLVLSGLFSVVGVIPLSVAGGFISTTGIKEKNPFIIGAIIILVTGFFPSIGGFFSTLPLEVAYASLFIPFAQMLGFGIRDLMGQEPSNRNLLVIGLSLMVGIGMMFMPPSAFESVAPWLRNGIANGLLVGLILCLLLEHVLFPAKKPKKVERNQSNS
ncbi:purine/pyrimidine permease [Neobacillus sp. SM06]|uniref:purine/pyrimidine permease n=1 Tax=Neobacillus sp. SM06 TaxID=3422492 RepID=UPI003D287934